MAQYGEYVLLEDGSLSNPVVAEAARQELRRSAERHAKQLSHDRGVLLDLSTLQFLEQRHRPQWAPPFEAVPITDPYWRESGLSPGEFVGYCDSLGWKAEGSPWPA